MGVSIEQYRVAIGIFNACLNYLFKCLTVFNLGFIVALINIMLFITLSIMLSGDIETNPGPKKDYINNLAICHWNLNSLWVENFEKLALITAFISLHKFDIFCVAETFLDSSVSDDDPRLALDGYSLLRADHPTDTRRGGVCIFYKSCLSLVHKPELSNLNECIYCLRNS